MQFKPCLMFNIVKIQMKGMFLHENEGKKGNYIDSINNYNNYFAYISRSMYINSITGKTV